MKDLGRIRKQLNPARRKKIATHATALISEERTLQELRHAHKLTQKRMADVLGIGQDSCRDSKAQQSSDFDVRQRLHQSHGPSLIADRRVYRTETRSSSPTRGD